MKVILLIAFTALFGSPTICQSVGALNPPISVIDTDAFCDPEDGIKILVEAMTPFEPEFRDLKNGWSSHVQKYSELEKRLIEIQAKVKPGQEYSREIRQMAD